MKAIKGLHRDYTHAALLLSPPLSGPGALSGPWPECLGVGTVGVIHCFGVRDRQDQVVDRDQQEPAALADVVHPSDANRFARENDRQILNNRLKCKIDQSTHNAEDD